MFWLYSTAPPMVSWYRTRNESTQDTATPRMVTVCEPARPRNLPRKPASTQPTSGASAIVSRMDVERPMCSALHAVDVGDVDRAARTEQQHQDRQADGSFRRGHGENEEHENLPRDVAEETRERHEVHVHGEQHQLDRHQQHDHVLAVDEQAGDGDAEQHRAKHDVVCERDHGCDSCGTVGSSGRTAAIFTMRTRSRGLTLTCW